jgi:hypothetical protein
MALPGKRICMASPSFASEPSGLVHGASVADRLLCPTPPSEPQMMQLVFARSAWSWNSAWSNPGTPASVLRSICWIAGAPPMRRGGCKITRNLSLTFAAFADTGQPRLSVFGEGGQSAAGDLRG